MSKKKDKKGAAVSDKKLFELADQVKEGKAAAATAETFWRRAQDSFCTEMMRLKRKALISKSGRKVSVVRSETVVYNEDGLWADLTAAQRKQVFDVEVSLAYLPKDVQKAVLEALTPAQKRQATRQVLNKEKLEEATAAKKIDLKVVSKNSEIKYGSPYIKESQEMPS